MKFLEITTLSLALSLSNHAFAENTDAAATKPAEAATSAATQVKESSDAKQAGANATGTPTATQSPSDYTCSMGDAKRTVRVAYEKEGVKVPCKVSYVRDVTSGEEKVLYSASAEEGYCEKKASEFAEKLKTTGWSCSTP